MRPPPNTVDQDVLPEIAVRIPGRWRGPGELASALPPACRLSDGRLYLPDRHRVDVCALPPDREFPRVFASSCRGGRSRRCLEAIRNYAVNICLAAPGGSMNAAMDMVRAAATIVRAGGAGVFVDNSGAAHTARDWMKLAEDPDDLDAFQAFVTTFASEQEMWSIGMHVFGLRDAVIRRSDDEDADLHSLLSFLSYSIEPATPIVEGDLAGDETAPRFRVLKESAQRAPSGSPLHNPYGQWRLDPLPE